MGKNGYFRIVNEENQTSIKLIPPTEGGKLINLNDVTEYLEMKGYPIDLLEMRLAVAAAAKEETVLLLEMRKRFPERECCKLTITPDNMKAYAKFYAASEGEKDMTAEEIVHDLEIQGIKYGIKQDVIERFIQNREYCEDILLAEGTPPIQGRDAYIEYKFNTDKKARPTLLEDGSVDFFNLNIINHCIKEEVLAVLHPEDPGEDGQDLFGECVKPFGVKKAVFKYGKNIALSEDGLELISMVDGHVELDGEKVIVSNLLIVDNVDTATGNIEFDGSVQVNGNVITNFAVKAQKDIVVNGVVEGATLESGGNIIIARGMNGMGRGSLSAHGNIVAKFLENATAQADGYVSSNSILHSYIMAGEEVNVGGKRGFITGGRVSAAGGVNVKTLGSEMGADTIVEVGIDPMVKNRITQLRKLIEEDTKTLKTIQPVLEAAMKKLGKGMKLSPDQMEQVQQLNLLSQQKTAAINANGEELDELMDQSSNTPLAMVKVDGTVYPGTLICIDDVSMTLREIIRNCRFVKERGVVKIKSL